MLKNYVKIIFRNFLRQKTYSFINITGLGVGIASTILILLWIQDELSYDRFHQNVDEIYRVIGNYDGTVVPAGLGPLAALLKEEIPEVVNTSRYYSSNRVCRYGDNNFELFGLLVEPAFFDIFDFQFVLGDPKTAFENLGSMVITEETAKKFFGDEDPMGKVVSGAYESDYKITGVLKDIPNNSSIQFDHLAPFDLVRYWKQPDSWTASDIPAYVQLLKGSVIEDVNQKLAAINQTHFSAYKTSFSLQPLTRIHLYSNLYFDAPRGNIQYIYIFAAIALFVLGIACINFMNLTTARFAKRSKEVGLRKVVGANRKQLMGQFFGESTIFALMALPFAFFIVELFLPILNNLSDKQLAVNYYDIRFILSSVALVILTGVFSGIYPALMLSSFHPVKILKNAFGLEKKGVGYRKILVVVQFALSIIVIVGALVIHEQLTYVRNKGLGYQKENLLYLKTGGGFEKIYESAKTELLQNPNIVSVTASDNLPTFLSHTTGVDWEGRNPEKIEIFQVHGVNYDYFKTHKMELVNGRFFSKEYITDSERAYVVNETAVKTMEMEIAVGSRLTVRGGEGRIIGVVRDFHFRSLHERIEPLVLRLGTLDREFNYLTIRIAQEDIPGTISFIKTVWEKYGQSYPFDFYFLDDKIDELYKADQRTAQIFGYCAFLAIFVSCLGLFGLATFVSEQRTKEIGVRKVLGATVQKIVYILTKDFTKWVLVANIIAWPLAWLAMNTWLQDFAYRINIGLVMFLKAGILAFGIALITVSFHAVKSALSNPVDTLRYE